MDKLEVINQKINDLKQNLMIMDYILRGTVSKTYMKCGKKECICHKDSSKLHGPYYIFTKKVKSKTIGKLYPRKVAELLTVYAKKYNKVIKIIRRISELSEKAMPLLLKQSHSKGGSN